MIRKYSMDYLHLILFFNTIYHGVLLMLRPNPNRLNSLIIDIVYYGR